jgi:Kef-type K+ transport system membrane component KefB
VDQIGLLNELGVLVVGATIISLIVRFFRGPSIIAFVLTGLVVGPATGLLKTGESIHLIAEFGIVLLLFIVGLELSLEKIKKVGKVALIAGAIQIVATALGGFFIAYLMGFGMAESVFIGIATTFSSTVVVVKLLEEKGDLDRLYGRIAVGIFLVQDIAVIFILTILAGIGPADAALTGDVGFSSIAFDISMAVGAMGVMLVVALAASKWFLPPLFEWGAKFPDMLFVWSLSWCFLFVYASYYLNLSQEIGAFLAGISLAQLPHNQDLRRRVKPLMSFFIVIFFVWLGLEMELTAAWEHLDAALAITGFVLVGKFLIFMSIISSMGYSEETSFSTSVTVAQISEFSFIVMATAMSLGWIGDEVLAVVAMVGLLTIGISSYGILYTDELYRRVRDYDLLRFFNAPSSHTEDSNAELTDHIIVVGMNALGRRLVYGLHEGGETVLAIDTNAERVFGLPGHRQIGDVSYKSLLDDAALDSAKLIVSTLHIDDVNQLIAYRGRQAGTPTAIHAFDDSILDSLEELSVTYLIDPRRDGVERQWGEIEDVVLQNRGTNV